MAIQEQIYQPQLAPAQTAPLPGADPMAYGAGIGASMEGLGDTLHRAQIQAYEADRRVEANQEASNAAVRLEQAKTDVENFEQAAQTGEVPGIGSGGEGYQEIVGQYARERMGKLTEGITEKDVAGSVTSRAEAYLGDVAHRSELYARGQGVIKMAADGTAALNQSYARVNRSDRIEDYAQAIEDRDAFWDNAKGISPELREKGKAGDQQTLAFGFLAGQAERNPTYARMLADSGRFDFLTPEQRESVLSRIETYQRRQAEADKALLTKAQQQQREGEEIILKTVGMGSQIDPDTIRLAAKQAGDRGDGSRAHDLQMALVRNSTNIIFGDQAVLPDQISARMGAIEKIDGWRSRPELVAEHDQLDTLRTQARDREANFTTPLNALEPASFAKREADAQTDARARGLAVPQFVNRDEIARYQDVLKTGLGGAIAVADELSHFSTPAAMTAARQIAPGDAMLATAVTITPQARALLLRGQEALKANHAALPDMTVQAKFDGSAGGALRRLPEDYQSGALQSAKLIAAALMQSKGAQQLTTAIWDEALHRALGGTWARDGTPQGGIGNWNGKKLLLPYRMSQADFDRRMAGLGKLNGFLSAAGSVTGDQLRRYYTPVNVGMGWFHFVDNQGRPLKAPDGSDAGIRITWNGR